MINKKYTIEYEHPGIFKVSSMLQQGIFKNIEEIKYFKEEYPESSGIIDVAFNRLIERGCIKISSEGKIDSFPETSWDSSIKSSIKWLPDCIFSFAKKALKIRHSKEDPNQIFHQSFVLSFRNTKENRAKCLATIINFYKSLNSIYQEDRIQVDNKMTTSKEEMIAVYAGQTTFSKGEIHEV